MERKTRQELQKELQELLAASKTSLTPSSANGHPNSSRPAAGDDGSEEARKSSERRKVSSELLLPVPHSSDLPTVTAANSNSTPKVPVCATVSIHSSGTSWGVQPGPKYELAVDEEQSSTCMPWLPFRAIYMALKRHPSIWITSLLVMLLLATGGIVGVMMAAANETQQARLAAEGFAINAGVAFERQLGQMFGPLLSLATIIRFDPYYPRVNASFDMIAAELLAQMPTQHAVTTLIAAPQGVLQNFYPLEGYCLDKCGDIHINLFKQANRREYALKTVQEGVLTMQGPMPLNQGYFGIVGRQPIYISPSTPNNSFGAPTGLAYNCLVCYNATTKTQFWGFVNAVINMEPLVNGTDSRMQDLQEMGYRYRMWKTEDDGSETLIACSANLPESPVSTSVRVPGQEWMLDVSPEQGWVPVWRDPVLAVVVFVSCLIGLLLGAILVSSRLQTWLKSANDALAQEKQRMDVLLARQYNLISCVLQQEGEGGVKARPNSIENRTLARIEDMRREIGVTNGSTGVDELQLIELMDEGTYGKVFRGLWRGSTVAVKTMVLPAKMSGAEKRERMAIMEAAISSAMNHPNIVQTYTYIIKPSSSSVACCHSSEGGSSSLVTAAEIAQGLEHAGGGVHLDTPEANAATVHNFEVSLVLEYCDWGSVRTALDAGAFFAEDNSLNYAAILDTAADVARAMMHLHKNQVLHSDLKVRNVLLKSDASGRGCVAKVADFGLAVRMDCMDTHVSGFQGTMSHMAPEALLHGRISKAGDMYSYGVTLWELFTGGQAYQGIPRALVGHKVAVLGLRPTLPTFTPPDFRSLIEECWAQDPEQRPSFELVLCKLVAMRHALGSTPTPPLQRYKLQPKAQKQQQQQEKRHSSEQNLADAQANGLVQMGSYYVSSTISTAYPLAPGSRHEGSLGMNGVYRHTGRSMGMTGCSQPLDTISDTEAEELEEDLKQQQQEQQQQEQQEQQEQQSSYTAAGAAAGIPGQSNGAAGTAAGGTAAGSAAAHATAAAAASAGNSAGPQEPDIEQGKLQP